MYSCCIVKHGKAYFGGGKGMPGGIIPCIGGLNPGGRGIPGLTIPAGTPGGGTIPGGIPITGGAIPGTPPIPGGAKGLGGTLAI